MFKTYILKFINGLSLINLSTNKIISDINPESASEKILSLPVLEDFSDGTNNEFNIKMFVPSLTIEFDNYEPHPDAPEIKLIGNSEQ